MSKVLYIQLGTGTCVKENIRRKFEDLNSSGLIDVDLKEFLRMTTDYSAFYNPTEKCIQFKAGLPIMNPIHVYEQCGSLDRFIDQVVLSFTQEDRFTHTRAGLGKYIWYSGSYYKYEESSFGIHWVRSVNPDDRFIPREVSNQTFEIYGPEEALKRLGNKVKVEWYCSGESAWLSVDELSVKALKRQEWFRNEIRYAEFGEHKFTLPVTSYDELNNEVFIASVIGSPAIQFFWAEGKMHDLPVATRNEIELAIMEGFAHTTRKAAEDHAAAIRQFNSELIKNERK